MRIHVRSQVSEGLHIITRNSVSDQIIKTLYVFSLYFGFNSMQCNTSGRTKSITLGHLLVCWFIISTTAILSQKNKTFLFLIESPNKCSDTKIGNSSKNVILLLDDS